MPRGISSATPAKIMPRNRYQWPMLDESRFLRKTSSVAPSGPPTSVPMPPMTTAISTSPETSQLTRSGEMKLMCCTLKAPATAAIMPDAVKAARR